MLSSPDLAPSGRRQRLRDKGGFTLVEVLVAFTVMATLLSVLFRGVVTMRAGSMAFDDHTHREILARAVLDDALADRDLAPGRYKGTREGYRWTLVAKPIDLSRQLQPAPDRVVATPGQAQGAPGSAAPTSAKASAPDWSPQRLTVRIEKSGAPLEVETIRLAIAKERS